MSPNCDNRTVNIEPNSTYSTTGYLCGDYTAVWESPAPDAPPLALPPTSSIYVPPPPDSIPWIKGIPEGDGEIRVQFRTTPDAEKTAITYRMANCRPGPSGIKSYPTQWYYPLGQGLEIPDTGNPKTNTGFTLGIHSVYVHCTVQLRIHVTSVEGKIYDAWDRVFTTTESDRQ
jgi:hypothetical protein